MGETADKVISVTKCSRCGEDIRLVVTKAGKFMPIQMDDHEPHFPRCGKGNISAVEWAKQLIEWGEQILRHNEGRTTTTKPKHKRKPYSGEAAPWS